MNTKQDFEAQLNTTFHLPLEEGELELTLIEISSVVAEKANDGQSEAFSIIFETQIQEHVEQGSYVLQHDDMGELLIFIVPIGPADTGMRYEAIFT